MSIRTFSSRDFTRDVSAAKRATLDGPVFITDRGRPAFALLKIDGYYRIAGQSKSSLLDVMNSIPGGGNDIDFDPPSLDLQVQGASFDPETEPTLENKLTPGLRNDHGQIETGRKNPHVVKALVAFSRAEISSEEATEKLALKGTRAVAGSPGNDNVTLSVNSSGSRRFDD